MKVPVTLLNFCTVFVSNISWKLDKNFTEIVLQIELE